MAARLIMHDAYLKGGVPMRLQVGDAAPVAKMQQVVQAAVLCRNKIGAQL